MLRYLTLLAALCVLPFRAAVAADGDPCSQDQNSYFGSSGELVLQSCRVLCDNDTADGDCATFDMKALGGVPSVMAFAVYENGTFDCTAGTFTIRHSGNGTLNAAHPNAYDLGSSTAVVVGGAKRLNLESNRVPLDGYIYVARTGMACTVDSADLLLITYQRRGL